MRELSSSLDALVRIPADACSPPNGFLPPPCLTHQVTLYQKSPHRLTSAWRTTVRSFQRSPFGMSSVAHLDLLVIAEFNALNRTFSAFGIALLYYDFLITIPLEVERYWTGSRSWASLFFFLNRYLAIISHIPVIYEFFCMIPESRCRQLQTFHQVITASSQGVVAICLLLRTHALYMRDRRILYLLGGLIALGGSISVWAIAWVGISQDYRLEDTDISVGCDLTVSVSQAILLAVTWGVMLIFDGTVFVLTLFQAVYMYRMWSHSLATLMLKDGTVYFGVLAIFYLSNIITYVVAPPAYKGIFTTVTNILSSVLVSRMMLNIRDPNLFDLPRRWPPEFGEFSGLPNYT